MSAPLDFSGKTALVVGGSSGIGNGIAHGFREAGARVIATGTRASASAYAAEEGSDLEGLEFRTLDVSDRTAIDRFGWPDPLDVVVLCQGAVRYGREEFERAGWDEVLQVNLTSVLDCANAARGALAKSGGSLIVISSVSAYYGLRANPAYGASKAGAVSLVKSLAAAFAEEGIRVNGIAPGYVLTKLNRSFLGEEDFQKNAIAGIPRGRLGTPEDMAGAALFLASPLADYIAGQTITVDGGMTLAG
ncbi:SDR family NAD(P)-dependent oxidoreductase [Qipengyuania sp. MTN3-11]|uniref:SDR family NAD(P)-dependent oxidoreductase n=1 Tax=Qipengyuania sp. MTN3-11 TaxID=3056557 RepID=UPI0036F1DC40